MERWYVAIINMVLPFNGNLTAALAALALTQSALNDNVYTDPALIALHDTVFAVTSSPSCYIGRCNTQSRALHTKKDIKANVMHGSIDYFNADSSSVAPVVKAYYVSCRDAVKDIVFTNASVDSVLAIDYLSTQCAAKPFIDDIISTHKAANNMKITLQYRINFLLEDVTLLYNAAKAALFPTEGGSGSLVT